MKEPLELNREGHKEVSTSVAYLLKSYPDDFGHPLEICDGSREQLQFSTSFSLNFDSGLVKCRTPFVVTAQFLFALKGEKVAYSKSDGGLGLTRALEADRLSIDRCVV